VCGIAVDVVCLLLHLVIKYNSRIYHCSVSVGINICMRVCVKDNLVRVLCPYYMRVNNGELYTKMHFI